MVAGGTANSGAVPEDMVIPLVQVREDIQQVEEVHSEVEEKVNADSDIEVVGIAGKVAQP
jgi:excinuclease UvrABC helicase subunit UvrB